MNAEPNKPRQYIQAGVARKQSLDANVARACPKCQAPGTFRDELRIKEGWPKCYDPNRKNESVGETCPHCGEPRPKLESLGTVWEKIWGYLNNHD